jgi:hypothetical protein
MKLTTKFATKLAPFLFLALALSACSSASKISNPDAPAAKSEVPTIETISERTTLRELSSARNVLRAVIAQASEAKGDENPGDQVIGCKLSGKRAKAMLTSVDGLIERRVILEAEDYSKDPRIFAKDNSFETCGAECFCGVLATVLDHVHVDRVQKLDEKVHNRFVTKLNAKAKLQGPEQTMTCARKQTWFCKSDLKTYLETTNPETIL